jgi:hypothetical protein
MQADREGLRERLVQAAGSNLSGSCITRAST